MRVVVVGATGNVGTAVVRLLRADPAVTELVGVARRPPATIPEGTSWVTADLGSGALDVVAGADVVVHLAWLIQPSHRPEVMHRTNVVGTRRLIDAVVAHGVRRLVVASSVGAYAPGPKQPPVDETWPATGVPTSLYSRHKATLEAMLDHLETAQPTLEVVRLRTSLVFQRAAGGEVRRLFLGPLAPRRLPRPLRVVPRTARLTFQATHADDVAAAYRLAVTAPTARGAYNVAADPPLDPARIAAVARARTVPIPPAVLRAAAAAVTYRLRLQPAEPGWLDMALQTPLMDTRRIRDELGWAPKASSEQALREVLAGLGEGAGTETAPLAPWRDGPVAPLEGPGPGAHLPTSTRS